MSDLARALDPESVAIAGLSDDPGKHGSRVLRHLQRHGFTGDVFGVNPRMPAVGDVPVYPSLPALPAPVDLVVAAVPAPVAVEVVREAEGVGGVIVFAAGFAESGPDGTRLEADLVAAAAGSGTRVIGPNSGGIIRPGIGLTASFLTCLDRPPDQLLSGPIAVVTQSGGTGSYIHNLAAGRREGIAISVSTGNEADLRLGEGIGAVSALDEVEVVVVVMETIRDGEAFIESVEEAQSRSRRLVVCRLGRSDRGTQLMATHTGAMAVPDRVLSGVLSGLGVIEAETPGEAYDMATLLARCPSAHGDRVGIVTHSGGAALMLSDLAHEVGLDLPLPSPDLADRLAEHLDHGVVSNPLDMGGIIGGPRRFAEVIASMAGSGEYDAVLAASTAHPPAHTGERVDSLMSLGSDVPIVHLWMAGDLGETGLTRIREAGLAVTEEPRAAIRGVAGLVSRPSRLSPREHIDEGPSFDWGLPFDPGIEARTAVEAVAAADELGYPVVVKVDAADLHHKTEVGGVVVDVRSPDEVAAAFERVVATVSEAGWAVNGVRIQRFRRGVELIVGAVWDDTFGALASVGAGGTLTEVIGDVAFRPGPVGIEQAREMVDSLSIRPILDGYRGASPSDVGDLCRIVSVVSHAVTRSGPIAELELNPLIWDGSSWIAVDWLLVTPP